MRRMTHDMWHLTCDMWHDGVWTFSKDVIFLAITVWENDVLKIWRNKVTNFNQWEK